ncbi:GGDEF domain-containing protein [Cellvibrio polysaccharolyticus]|uniref:Diguanylate cyclase n=1 Tax=Cellvibrio polysaccharolyticus TaxID=2082724 RepID=A0A928YVN8_9GAMM|nr:diguanylate cyclase [Cellvibrio polysaccharolyticus]MBE8718755.1 diguanylate cyclase [Cellvibrio polysaccharolyticus]
MSQYFSLAFSTLMLILITVFVWSVVVFTSGYNVPRDDIDTPALIHNLAFSLSAFLLLCVIAWLPIRRPIAIRLMTGFSLVFVGACQKWLGNLVDHAWPVTQVVDMLAIPVGLLIAASGLFELGKAYRLNRLMIGSYRKIEQSLATVDQITQLPNRRVFLSEAPLRLSPDEDAPHSDELICLRINNLRDINRQYDFNTGDAVLSQVARHITRHTDSPALAARFNGSGFYILLPATSRRAAESLAAKLISHGSQQAINVKPGEKQLLKIELTVQHSTRIKGETLEAWLHRLD